MFVIINILVQAHTKYQIYVKVIKNRIVKMKIIIIIILMSYEYKYGTYIINFVTMLCLECFLIAYFHYDYLGQFGFDSDLDMILL